MKNTVPPDLTLPWVILADEHRAQISAKPDDRHAAGRGTVGRRSDLDRRCD